MNVFKQDDETLRKEAESDAIKPKIIHLEKSAEPDVKKYYKVQAEKSDKVGLSESEKSDKSRDSSPAPTSNIAATTAKRKQGRPKSKTKPGPAAKKKPPPFDSSNAHVSFIFLKFIYSEKATKNDEISKVFLSQLDKQFLIKCGDFV